MKASKQAMISALEKLCHELGANDPTSLALQIILLTEGAIVQVHTFNDPAAAQSAKTAALALAHATTAQS